MSFNTYGWQDRASHKITATKADGQDGQAVDVCDVKIRYALDSAEAQQLATDLLTWAAHVEGRE